MTRYVAFLGSINVGGHRVTMDRLRKEFESLGFVDVSTFIASGNVVFRARGTATALEKTLETHLPKRLGFPVTAFVRTAKQVVAIAAREPFSMKEGDTQYVAFLRSAPTALAIEATHALSNDRDTFSVHGSELHWRIHGTSLDSSVKGSVLAKAIQRVMTSRNAKSLRKLAAMLDA